MGFSQAQPSSTVILDGDDTLWRTMPLYAAAKRRYFSLMNQLDFDVQSVEEEFEARDAKNVAAWGFTLERFRRSMVETYEESSRRADKTPMLRTEQRISRIATSVVRNKTRRAPHALNVLRRLHGRCRLVLLTKGEYSLQERRVAESGLGNFFERVVIVEHKDSATFRRVVSELRSEPERTWSVGDSLRSDIKPALEARIKAVWIPQETWGYEVAEPFEDEHLIRAHTIGELPSILKKVGAIP